MDTSFIRPDMHNLEEEWASQPENYYNYAIKLAHIKNKYEEAKRDLELETAEMDRSIRASPLEYDLEKITEGGIEKAIIRSGRYRTAQDKVLKAKHHVDIVQAAVSALDHKKKALEALVQLHLANYFSEPKLPQTVKEDVERKERKVAFSGRKRVK